jgi:hypothetical protein
MKKLLFVFLLLSPATLLAQVDSATMRPDGDVFRAEWNTAACGTTNLFAQIDEATTDDADYVTLDNCIGGDCSGCLNYSAGVKEVTFSMEDANSNGIPFDSFAFYVRHQILVSASAGDSAVFYFSMQGSDCVGGGLFTNGRLGKATLSTSFTTQRFSFLSDVNAAQCFTDGRMDSLQISIDGALSLIFEDALNISQMWVVGYYNRSIDVTFQPGLPPHVIATDTLFAVGAGTATALSTTCAANWQCVDEDPDAGGCSSTAADTNYAHSTTPVRDYYKLGTHGANTRWGKRGSANKQIDCLAMSVCVHKGTTESGTGTRTIFCRIGLRDSAGTEMLSDTFSTTTAANTIYTRYFFNTTENGNTRWDSTSLLGLQASVELWGSHTTHAVTIKNMFVIVYTSTRDTSVCDSVDANAIKPVYPASPPSTSGLQLNRQSACLQSPLDTRKIWVSVLDQATTNRWVIAASDDSGVTWDYIPNATPGNPDTAHIRVAADGISSGGLYMTGDAKNIGADSFRVAGASVSALDHLLIYQTKNPSQARTDLTPDNSGTGRKDSVTSTTAIIQYPAVYQWGDTVLAVGGTATAATGKLVWYRSINRGATWPDSGTFPKNGVYTTLINSTAGSRRVAFVRMSGGYPGIFVNGWSGDLNMVMFYQWHPKMTATGALTVDSIQNLVWVRNPGGPNDSVRCRDIPANSISNSGEMVAASVFRASDTIVHFAANRAGYIVHGWIDTDVDTCVGDTVMDVSEFATSGNGYMAMAVKDTLLYLFFTYPKTVNGTTDSSRITFCLWAGNRFRGPRPLSFWNSTRVQARFPSTAQYQTGNYAFAVWTDTVRATTTYRYLYFNRIVKPQGMAAAGTPTPLRRRRIILEKNKPYGETDEKDSTAVPARRAGVVRTEE